MRASRARPKAPFMRGSRNPRKRSSSPSTVLKTNSASKDPEPAPGDAASRSLPGVRVRGTAGRAWPGGPGMTQEPLDSGGDDQRHSDEPQLPSGAVRCVEHRGARSQSASRRHRRAQRSLFTPDGASSRARTARRAPGRSERDDQGADQGRSGACSFDRRGQRCGHPREQVPSARRLRPRRR